MRCKKSSRRGVTAVEFALCAPLVFLLFFGAWEFSRAYMILHTMENAAYEGARRGIVPGATAADVEAAAQTVMNSGHATPSDIDVSPSSITNQTEEVTVTIQLEMDDNFWVSPFFLAGKSIERTCTLAREMEETVY